VYSTGRASAAAATGPLEPGGNVAAALSTGDVTAAGVGTVADVCDTQAVLFGHPMRFDGATLLGAHAADAVYVQPDPAFTPYKVANIGESVGIVDQDRLGGLRATLGPAPSVSQATSTLSGTATGLTRTGTTQIVAQDDLPTIAGLHVLANLDRVADRIGGGTTELDYVVSGTREDGTPWTLQRREHVGHQFDTSFLSFFAALAMLGSLSSAPAEDVAVTSVDVTGTIDATYRMAQLTGVELRSRGSWVPIGNELSLTAGTRVALRATFRQVAGSGPDFTVPLTLQVPAGLSGQRGVLRVAAGGFCDADGNCQPPAEGSSFDDLLAAWSQAPTGDSVTATLVAMTETAEGEEPEEVLLSSATATAPMTVTGSDAAAATIVPPRGPRPAVVSGDRWALRTSLSGGQPWRTFTFGVATDIPVMGDWDGNGTATPGVFRNGTWYLRSSVFTTDRSVVGFGRAGDRPVVGDWDADGDDDLGVYRSGRFLLRGPSGGVAWDVPFGRAGDLPVAGDWDGDGDDTVGTFRAGGTWSLTDELAAGPATYQVRYGTQAGDRPVTGDWDADGATGIGIYRSGTWHLRDAIVGGATSQRFAFGSATGKPVVWR
jgi:hypothetical protein